MAPGQRVGQVSRRGGQNPMVTWYVNTRQRAVALTFDDGPSPLITPEILALLKKYHDRATFFVLGQKALKYPRLLKTEVQDGMEVGNHTFGHINLTQYSTAVDYGDLMRTRQIIWRIVHTTPLVMRPPYGAYSPGVLQAAAQAGERVVLWSSAENSPDHTNSSVSAMVFRIIHNLRPGDIVLFHDGNGGGRWETVAALAIILKDLKSLGYQCVTVSQLLKMQ